MLSSSFLANITPLLMGYAVFFIGLALFVKLWPWKNVFGYIIIRDYGFPNLFYSLYLITL